MLSSIKHRVSRIQTNHPSFITLITLITIECFLFTSLTPIPTAKLTTHFSPPTTHSALRPRPVRNPVSNGARAGQGATEIQSALDGGRKKSPQPYKRKTDEEVRIAYLFTHFNTLHGEIERVTTLLTRLKGKMTGEEETAMQLEFDRLLVRIKDLSKELPQLDTDQKDVATLRKKNKELAQEIRKERQKISEAFEKKEEERLAELNTQLTQKLWLRSWVELELAYHFLSVEKNPTAALALLIGVRNRMADLQTEYWWRRVRKVIDQKTTQETLEGWFGTPVEVTYVGEYDIKRLETGEVTIYRRHWRTRTIPTASGEMTPVKVSEVTPFKFKDMPTALRSEIHIVVSQGEAYREILHALANLQHVIRRIEQQKETKEAMPKKELQAALEMTTQWADRGIATDLRRQALPDLENAKVYLEKELYEVAASSMKTAQQKLRHALERQERTGRGTRARALVLLNEWRTFVEKRERLVAGLNEALESAHPKTPLELLRRLDRLKKETIPSKPTLLVLQKVDRRLNQTFVLLRRASDLLAKKERLPQEERQIYSLSGAAKKNLRLMLKDLGVGEEGESARDGGKGHSREEFLATIDRLTEQLGKPPDSKTLAKELGITQGRASSRAYALGRTLSPIPEPPNASPFTLYVKGLTHQIPPDHPVTLRREKSYGTFQAGLIGSTVGALPESLGERAIAHFTPVEGQRHDWVVSFKPQWAPETEPPHAMRLITVKDNKEGAIDIEIEKNTKGANALHDIRRLRIMGIDYEKLSPHLKALRPGQIVKKVMLFAEFDERVSWDWIVRYPVKEIRKRLEERRALKAKRAETFRTLKAPPMVRETFASEEEILARIQLFEMHGVPFNPLYWNRVARGTRQKILEGIPHLQFLHFMLRLYGIKSAQGRNKVIAANPQALLQAGAHTRLSKLRRAIAPYLGKRIPPVYPNEIGSLINILMQNEQQRERLLAEWLTGRVKNSSVDTLSQNHLKRLTAIYDYYLQGGKLSTASKRLRRLSEEVADPELLSDIQAFSDLLKHIQEGEKEVILGALHAPRNAKESPPPWRADPPRLPRIFRGDFEELYELFEAEKLGKYLARQPRKTLLPHDQILKEASLDLINSVETLKRALGVLSHLGFILSYQKEGVIVLDPFLSPQGKLYPTTYARDGGKRISDSEFVNTHRRLTQNGHLPNAKTLGQALDLTPQGAKYRSDRLGLSLSTRYVSDAKFRKTYNRLSTKGKPPDSVTLAEALGLGVHWTRERAHALGLTLTKISDAHSLTLYANEETDEVPRDHVAKMRSVKGKFLEIRMGRASIKGLPESLGKPGDKINVHYEKAGNGRDAIVSFTPLWAPETEPPHAKRRLVIKNKNVKVRESFGPNRMHDLRRLRALGIFYETLPPYVRTIAPSQLYEKILIFYTLNKPIVWSRITGYSVETMRRQLTLREQGEGRNERRNYAKAIEKIAQKRRALHKSLPRLFKEEEIPPKIEKLVRNYPDERSLKEILRDFEYFELEVLGEYLTQQPRREMLPYRQILREAVELELIDSVETLKRALGILAHQGYIFSYQKEGVVVLDIPFPITKETSSIEYARDGSTGSPSLWFDELTIPLVRQAHHPSNHPERSRGRTIPSNVEGEPSRATSRDGGVRVPEDIPALFRMRGLVSGFASNVLSKDPNFWRVRSVARYVVSRKEKHALPSDQDFEEFKKSLDEALGSQIRAILSDHKFSESEVDEMYTLLLELLEKALFMDDRYDYAFSIAERLPNAEAENLALLNYEADDPHRPALQTVIASIQEAEVAQAVTRVQEQIQEARTSLSEEERNAILEFVLSIAGDRARSHFGEKLTASDGGARTSSTPQPFLKEIRRTHPALTSP